MGHTPTRQYNLVTLRNKCILGRDSVTLKLLLSWRENKAVHLLSFNQT